MLQLQQVDFFQEDQKLVQKNLMVPHGLNKMIYQQVEHMVVVGELKQLVSIFVVKLQTQELSILDVLTRLRNMMVAHGQVVEQFLVISQD